MHPSRDAVIMLIVLATILGFSATGRMHTLIRILEIGIGVALVGGAVAWFSH